MDSKNYGLVALVIGTLVIIVGIAVWAGTASSGKLASMSTRDIALLCTTDMATQFHIHPHLDIVVNGQKQVIPAEIGITDTCMNSIHTHDDTGTLHVEAPEKRDFTLGDFFAVWGKTFTKDQILGSKADATHTISVTVNGQAVDTYENTVLRDLDQIVITYGN
jgi:hypothetical protein